MAISIDYSGATYRIIIPQADLTLISGNLYELDTDAFWDDLKLLEAAETGICYQDAQSYNAPYTVFGVTYAPKVEILNATNSSNTDVYEIFFSPDTQYSVRLVGSNNNIADLQNAILANTTTQVIPGNTAGLQIVTTGSGLSSEQDTKLTRIHALLDVIEGTLDHQEVMRILLASAANKLAGAATTNVTIRDLADTKNRIDATVDADGNRTAVTLDAS